MNSHLDSKNALEINKKNIIRKKQKRITKTIIIVLITIALIFGCAVKLGLFKRNNVNTGTNLTTYTVSTRDITQILTGTGTIEPKNQYTINALVSGEIIEDFFEEGDTVTEDQILYKIDSDNLDSSVTKAENALKNPRVSWKVSFTCSSEYIF